MKRYSIHGAGYNWFELEVSRDKCAVPVLYIAKQKNKQAMIMYSHFSLHSNSCSSRLVSFIVS